MNWSSFKYLARQGLHSLRANRLMTLASIGVLTACLVLTGIAGLFGANINSLVAYLGDQNETVVYLDTDLTDEQLAQVDEAIRSMEGLASVTYMSKDAVLETYKGYMGEYADLWDGFEGSENPFMANYRVVLEDLADLDAKVAELEAIPGVSKVNPPTELAGVFLGVQKAVNIAAWSLVGVLVVVSVVVISNTIRLTVFSRRKEINIMKYVGATNGFIRLPFFVEGMTSGFISGCSASAAVLGGYALVLYFSDRLEGLWETVIGASLLPMGQIWYFVVGGFLLFGVLIGSLGTAVSVRKHLKV